MSISFKTPSVGGFDKELLLNVEGYLARPATVSKATIPGLAPNNKGRYIIPQGTLVVGAKGSILTNPMQEVVQATVTQTRATATVASTVVVTAKAAGTVAYTVALEKGTTRNPSVSFDGTALVVKLAVNRAGNVTTTYDDVVTLINNDTVANSYVVASIADGADGSAVAAATSDAVALAGGAAEAVTGNIDGVLYHSVDVTDGEAPATVVISGIINVDNMPVEPSDAVKAKLPHIIFGRID